MATMKAVSIHEYGGPEVLRFEDAPRPEPGPGQVLVRISASGVNPVDWKVRTGELKHFLQYKMPMIPGWDFSGVVEALGPGSARFKVGDQVYGHPAIPRNGTYAQYIAVPESEAAFKPTSIDHVHAAAIPLAALTVWQALFDTAKLEAGQTVLIHGAAGGVGTFAVQLAKMTGARVIGTASTRNHEFLRELGADETIDYNTTRFETVVRDADVVLDTITGETMDRSWQVLKKGGILISILQPPSEQDAAAWGVRGAHVFVQPNADQLKQLAGLIDSGKLKAVVERVLPLAEARHAQELSETGHARGKIVLTVD
jgi:NADPH:quinone reductase-like Zn-dependent oxidoreductase